MHLRRASGVAEESRGGRIAFAVAALSIVVPAKAGTHSADSLFDAPWPAVFAITRPCGYGSRLALRLAGTTAEYFRFECQTARCHCEERKRRSNPDSIGGESPDCFAPLAMTSTWLRIPAASSARVLLIITLENERAQGRPGAGRTRSLVCSGSPHKTHTRIIAGSTDAIRPSLRDGLRLIACSPRCPGFDSHRRPAKRLTELDPSVGRSGPHAFAVRVGVARLATPTRPSHPAPTFVTIAIRPS
jgi:hypothetical protein